MLLRSIERDFACIKVKIYCMLN